MSQKPEDANPFDPFAAWRGARDSSLDVWSKAMIDLVNTEGYAQAQGAMMDAYLTASAPFQQAMQTAMTQALSQLNMPSRDEVTSLAERLTNIEMRLDDMDAKLDEIAKGGKQPAAAGRRGSAKEQAS